MKLKILLKVSFILNIVFICLLIFLLIQTQLFRFFPKHRAFDSIVNELVMAGGKALASEDVPVGAIIVYQDEVIGRGFNTVFRDGNIAGHAEINAVNDAISNMGVEAFLELDRSKINVISTYEPCEMCRGMLVHYRIRNVKFLKDKTFQQWIKSDRAGIIYELNKRQTGNENIQDSLFLLHPRYPGKK